MEKKIVIMNEGTSYKVEGISQCVEAIIEAHINSSIESATMDEILENTCIIGFSAKDVTDIYADCVRYADNDLIVRFTDDTDETTLSDYELEYTWIGVC